MLITLLSQKPKWRESNKQVSVLDVRKKTQRALVEACILNTDLLHFCRSITNSGREARKSKMLKKMDTIANCQRQDFSLGVSQQMHKKNCENLSSIGHRSCEIIKKEKTP